MTLKSLQAFAIAFGLASVAAIVTAPMLSVTAEAATVRPAVGKPLQAAVSLANSGSGAAAMAKVHEAESVPNLTASEQSAISQTRNYVSAKTGAGGGAVGCKTKFANDYSANRFHDVVGEDADCLRKSGGYDFQSQVVVAQAYYQMGDYDTAIRMLKGLGDNDQVLSLLMSAAGKSGDTQTEGQVAERLILKGQTKFWTYLLAAAEGGKRLTDHQLLNVYRVRLATGNMRSGEDYETAAQLALEFGFSTEAQNIAQKGIDAKLLSGDRDMRLVNLAKTQAAKDAAGLADAQKKAAAAKNGDALVKLGEDLWGYGKYPDAINAIQAGIKKGVSNPNDANMALGVALLSSGQKDAAVRAFGAVKGDPGSEAVASLWTVYARAGGTVAAPTAPTDTGARSPKSGRHRH